MEFQSILDLEESAFKDQVRPAFFVDLNLDQILELIQFQWSQEVRPYFGYFPQNEACEAYRRNIYQDVKREAIQELLMNYVNQMRERRTASENEQEVEENMQRVVWHIWEIYHYCRAFEDLYRGLAEQKPASEGFVCFCQFLENYLQSVPFVEMRDRVYALHQELTGFQLIFTIENDLITLNQGELPGTYDQFLEKSFPGHKKKLRSPFAGTLHLSNLELELITMFRKKNPSFFRKAEAFSRDYPVYANETLLRFDQEIGYYLAFCRFEEKMKREGFEFAVPATDSSREICAHGLYDLALACANYQQKKEVVSNDLVYHPQERFFVVTGPNQGGKTTFARSLGQLIYFTKMGLDVPAVSANVHYFTNILTHFSVEESIETGRGKLKEELSRLAPMMSAINENAFVIINELFTTAANYDACIMGKRVLEHFEQQRCHGVYVTHLKELGEGGEAIVSLRALVEEIEEEQPIESAAANSVPPRRRIRSVRRFKMIRSPAEDNGCASDLVEKYQLTYEQLRARLNR